MKRAIELTSERVKVHILNGTLLHCPEYIVITDGINIRGKNEVEVDVLSDEVIELVENIKAKKEMRLIFLVTKNPFNIDVTTYKKTASTLCNRPIFVSIDENGIDINLFFVLLAKGMDTKLSTTPPKERIPLKYMPSNFKKIDLNDWLK